MLKKFSSNSFRHFFLFLLGLSLLFIFSSRDCLAYDQPDQTTSANLEAKDSSPAICLFNKEKATELIKRAINLEGYMVVTRVETKDGSIRITSSSAK